MSLDPVIETYLSGNNPRNAHLVEFCFKTQARRVWNGNYQLTAGGHVWFPLNKLGSIEGIDDPGILESQEMRFTVSGVDTRFLELFTMVSAEAKEEYVGRHVRVYLQFFDEEWQKLGDPVARAFGLMSTIGVSARPVESDGVSYIQRVIAISADNFLANRRSPRASFYTHLDQQLRSPGDRGLQHISDLIETQIPQPF